MTLTYESFLEGKSRVVNDAGFDVDDADINPMLYPFQRKIVQWALRKGRAAIFADCGLGKTPMQIEWGRHVADATGKSVLILTPLAVGAQTAREGEKFGVCVSRVGMGEVVSGLNVTNYERLHYFHPDNWGGVICDESSILKNFDGKRKAEITEFMRRVPYRLLCTATAAPNDYTELGTSSEALGHLGHIDMLNQFFTNKNNTVDLKKRFADAWRFKAHGEAHFWRWVSSWARALRKPSDMGFDDEGFGLPALNVENHVVETRVNWHGQMLPKVAEGLDEQRKERRATIKERCELAAQLVDHDKPAVIWCHLNPEGDLLEKLIPDAVQISGSDSGEKKEQTFIDFREGKIRVLITKPKIGAFGLNWQHCAHVVYFVSHSYEQYYQAVRRCWRFGQEYTVKVDAISSEGDVRVLENLERKADEASKMFDALIAEMYNPEYYTPRNEGRQEIGVPNWLQN